MLWVRRNRPRVNSSNKRAKGGRERGLAGDKCSLEGKKNLTALSLNPSLCLCIALFNISCHLLCSSLSLLRHTFSFCGWGIDLWLHTVCFFFLRLAGYVCHTVQLLEYDLNRLWPESPKRSILLTLQLWSNDIQCWFKHRHFISIWNMRWTPLYWQWFGLKTILFNLLKYDSEVIKRNKKYLHLMFLIMHCFYLKGLTIFWMDKIFYIYIYFIFPKSSLQFSGRTLITGSLKENLEHGDKEPEKKQYSWVSCLLSKGFTLSHM